MPVLKYYDQATNKWSYVGTSGPAGQDGYTPVKGTDYFTEEDKAELVEMVLAALPNGDEVYY